MKHCKKVTISLTVDRLIYESVPDELDLFRLSGEAYFSIYEMAKAEGIEIEQPIQLVGQQKWNHPSLRPFRRNV